VVAEATPLAATLDSPGRKSLVNDAQYGLAVETGQHERGLKALHAGLAHERSIGATAMIRFSGLILLTVAEKHTFLRAAVSYVMMA